MQDFAATFSKVMHLDRFDLAVEVGCVALSLPRRLRSMQAGMLQKANKFRTACQMDIGGPCAKVGAGRLSKVDVENVRANYFMRSRPFRLTSFAL